MNQIQICKSKAEKKREHKRKLLCYEVTNQFTLHSTCSYMRFTHYQHQPRKKKKYMYYT